MPGTGESPIKGSHDAERLWAPIFGWVDSRQDIDRSRVAVYGMSTGGYWATKVAHCYPGKVFAAINHGGPAHFAFARSWIESSEHGEYPLELAETLASAWGLPDRGAWIDYAPSLSLLDSGLLEKDSAPMLLLNGTDDTVFPIEDMYLLMRHGRPKTGRFYDGYGHMGASPKAPSTIVAWLRELAVTTLP
jgi:esterase FrsA